MSTALPAPGQTTAAPAPDACKSEGGMVAKLTSHWSYWAPLAILAGAPALVNEFIVIDMETQILGAFMFTVAVVKNEFGDSVGKMLEAEQDEVRQKMRAVDEKLLKGFQSAVKTNEGLVGLESGVKQIHALTDDMAVVQADYLNNLEEHKYRDAIAKKLDALVALEDSASNAIRNRMLSQVHSNVVSSFKTDAKAKEAALAQALAVIQSSNATSTAKMNKDVVGEYFASSLKNYKDQYAKQADKDEILIQLEKDVKHITKAPATSTGAGGNVYELRSGAAKAH